MKNSLAEANAGTDGNSKPEPREEKKKHVSGVAGEGQVVHLRVDIGGDEEHARDETREPEDKLKPFRLKKKYEQCQARAVGNGHRGT